MRSQTAAGQRETLLSLDDEDQQGRVEEQQEEEVSTEEKLPWVPVHCQAGFESGGGSRPPEAPELRVRPPQVGGLAKDLRPSLLLRSPFLRAWHCIPSSGPCFGLAPY